MNVIVFTDEEIKSLRFVLKDYFSKTPDKTTKTIINKLKLRKNT